MDKILIAMCDCPEIQDRWKPKVGDRIWLNSKEVVIESVDMRHVEQWLPENFVYIPRIEDVLDWLVPKHFKNYSQAHSRIHGTYYIYDMAIKGWLDMAIKGWLDMAMLLEHNKTWNGEAWE